ncbi:hypothetical protein AGABI2DRAFT_179115, partial [Agaricus bisporus var. bisporus H97]|uniref:hypothetical protein n=1 Tax=Agaricus bisporus var. bisporus (strain H97 / ATCC MYA-4626 / FGSC 10389) TaxID=936046 RepID=UPI00029F6E9A
MDGSTTTQDDLKRLDASTARIDDEIHDLLVERAHICRYANSLRDTTRILPPETLTSIFEFLVHEKNFPVYNLVAVCFRWRQVIWTSPTLWTTIFLNSTRHGVWDHFNLHCRNAKDAPLAIHLSTYHGFQAPLNPLLQLSAAVFTNCANRVRSITLGPIDKTVWGHVSSFAIPANFPRLKTLKLEFKNSSQTIPEGILFLHSPCLREIEITEPLPGVEFHLPFQQLTSLTLKKTSTTRALTCLTYCPNLVHFSSEGFSAVDPGAFEAKVPITLPDLETLAWESEESPDNATFMSDIHLPSVLRLRWLGPLNPATSSIWQPFFSRMSMVKSLECTYSAGLFALLASLPSLERVHIKFDLFFSRLGAVGVIMSHMVYREGVKMLPHLTELSVALEDQSKVVSKEILPFQDVMVEALQSRRSESDGVEDCVRLRKFTLQLSVLAVWGTWERHLLASLKQLDQSDLEVVLIT